MRRKGKGIKGAHDSDSDDSEFPAVAMNLHRAGFSVHQGGGGGGGGGAQVLGVDTAPELLMLLNAAEELEMMENPHANVFRGVKRKAARDVIGAGGIAPSNLGGSLNAAPAGGLNNPMAALQMQMQQMQQQQMQQQQQQQQQAMMGGMGGALGGINMQDILAAQFQLAQQQQQQQQQQQLAQQQQQQQQQHQQQQGGVHPVEAAIMMARQMQAAQGQFSAQAQFPQQQQQHPQQQQQHPQQQPQQLDLAQWQQIIAAQQHAQQQFVAAQSAATGGWGGATAAAAGSAPASTAVPAEPSPSVVGFAEPEPATASAPPPAATAELDAFIQQLATRAAELYAQLGPHATVVQTLTTLVVACHRGGYKRDAELAAGQLWEVIRASRFPGGVGETSEGIAVLRAQLGAMMDQALGAEGAAMLAAAGAPHAERGDASGLVSGLAGLAAAQTTQTMDLYGRNGQNGADTGVGAH